MNVLHVIPSVATRYGGPSVAVIGYCRALETHGVATTIVTTNADGDGVLPVPVEARTTFQGINTWFFARRGEAFKYSSGLATWLKKNVAQFDLVHIHAVFSHSSIAAGRAARAAGVPYLVRPLGSLDPWSLGQQAWKKRVLLWSAVGSLLDHAAGIHFTTEDEQQLAVRVASGTPGRVVSLGVDDTLLSVPPGSLNREPRVLVIARLHPKKNLGALIRAFHRVTESATLNQWRLTIAGTGEPSYVEQLRVAAGSGPAASRIELLDWVDGLEKQQMFARSSLFAVTSHQENFGLALIEALACGLPVVVSRGVNLAKAVAAEDAGWLCDVDESSIADTLRSAMTDDVGRGRRSARARELARRYTWTNAAAELAAWYGDVVRAQPAVGARA